MNQFLEAKIRKNKEYKKNSKKSKSNWQKVFRDRDSSQEKFLFLNKTYIKNLRITINFSNQIKT